MRAVASTAHMKARLARRPSELDAGICWNLRVEGSGPSSFRQQFLGGCENRTKTCSVGPVGHHLGQPRHERRDDGICTCEAGTQETAS